MKKTLVDICNAEWEIREVTLKTLQKHSESDDFLDGLCDYDNQRIYINKEMHPHRKAVTLAHEWLHVIIDYVGLGVVNEEKLVGALEHHVYQMVERFPEDYKS